MSHPLTLAEAASRLRKSKRWLQDWLAQNPVDAAGRPFCSRLGRSRLFRESDIDRILDATAASNQPCRSSSTRPAPVKRRTGRSVDPICGSAWTEAQELTGDPQLSASSTGFKTRSNVVSIRPGRE